MGTIHACACSADQHDPGKSPDDQNSAGGEHDLQREGQKMGRQVITEKKRKEENLPFLPATLQFCFQPGEHETGWIPCSFSPQIFSRHAKGLRCENL